MSSIVRIESIKIDSSGVLGTAVKISLKLNINTADTATITIEDPVEVERVSDASMTKEADKIYSYVYQSSTSYEDGDYLATIEIVTGSYTTVIQKKFNLVEQD